eukprot:906496-Rhodomonas_salina.2
MHVSRRTAAEKEGRELILNEHKRDHEMQTHDACSHDSCRGVRAAFDAHLDTCQQSSTPDHAKTIALCACKKVSLNLPILSLSMRLATYSHSYANRPASCAVTLKRVLKLSFRA